MPTDQRWPPPRWSGICCPGRPPLTPTGICGWGTSTCSTWPRSSERPCSSMTSTTCDTPAGPRWRPGGRGGLRRQGLPLPGHGPPGPRRGHASRCGFGRRAPRGPLRRRAGGASSSFTATTIRRGVGRRLGKPAWDGSSSTPSTRSPAWAACSTRRRRARSDPASWSGSRPGSRRTPMNSCAPGRRTPSSGSRWRRVPRPKRWPPSNCCPGGAGRGARPHRQPGLRCVVVRTGGRGTGPLLRPAGSARARGGRRAGRALRQRRVGAHAKPSGLPPRVPRAPGPAWTLRRGSRPSRGGRSSPRPA